VVCLRDGHSYQYCRTIVKNAGSQHEVGDTLVYGIVTIPKLKMTSTLAPRRSTPSPTWLKVLRAIGITVIWFVLALLTLWAVAALYVDCRIAALRIPLVLIYVLGMIAVLIVFRRTRWAATLCFVGFCCVLMWWLRLEPSNDGNWQPDAARTAWAEMDGDRVTIHNLRNCDYRTETLYSNCWGDRTVSLSQIRAADFFLINWGLRWASHPIVSFQFGDNLHIAFSIEARYKAGQSYSPILGFFRQYGLMFVAADERDVIRLRSNYRKDEEVYMYRVRVEPEIARAMFLTYVAYLNKLKDQPEWYNALTRNCTTTLDKQLAVAVADRKPWSYRLIVNGTLDELLYDRGRLVTGGLPFPELKAREHINEAARAANQSTDFSARIRAGRVGF
jgi:hypothetical protein